ncbi:tRNA (adenosine(37)-N6)-threonylcarbamoyltransferase complex dimerization subunit type 1 TsaB [soil metagenome]
MLLAIDTSAGTAVALVDLGGGVLAEAASADTRSHAEVIGSLIAEVMEGTAVTALSGVAVGMGPGPFTGLRVGIAAAQAFAQGAGTPVLRVGSHDAIAAGYYAHGGDGPLLVVTDARRREVYWSTFSGAGAEGIPVREDGPALATPDALHSLAGHHRLDAAEVPAGALGLLAEAMRAAGRRLLGPTPLYLRSPDVSVPGTSKRVS